MDTKYTLYDGKLLGRGGDSGVYLGVEQKTGRMVAIKKVNITTKNYNNVMEEVSVISLLQRNPHPSIVEYYDVYINEKTVYIVMEYCDGGSLSGIAGKPIKELYVQFYFSQLVEGVKHLRGIGISHSDLKLDNVLLTDDKKKIKIIDFNLWNPVNNRISCGSPMYLAPEIIRMDKQNNKTDIWSLGIILYRLLYGVFPYTESARKQLFDAISSRELQIPPTDTKTMVSSECLNLLSRMLEKNIYKRIGWDKLYNHPWFEKYEFIVDNDRLSMLPQRDSESESIHENEELCIGTSVKEQSEDDPYDDIIFELDM